MLNAGASVVQVAMPPVARKTAQNFNDFVMKPMGNSMTNPVLDDCTKTIPLLHLGSLQGRMLLTSDSLPNASSVKNDRLNRGSKRSRFLIRQTKQGGTVR